MKTSNFQFTNPRIVETIFISNPQINPNNGAEYKIEVNCKVGQGEINNNTTDVKLTIILNESENYMKEHDKPFYSKVSVIASFSWTNNLSENEIKRFLNINAPALLLSYIRPQIMYNSTQAGFPAYNLPFMNFAD